MSRVGSPLVLAIAASLAMACLDVADRRAEVDQRIGQASWAGSTIEVLDGLAAVRTLTPPLVHLWGSAPAFSFILRPGPAAGLPWRVRIENLMPDAVLAAVDGAGVPVPLTLVAAPFPTDKTWQLVPLGGAVSLFVQVPKADVVAPFRFGVFADVQEAVNQVQDIFARMNAVPDMQFVMMSGDLTEEGDAEQLERFQLEMKSLRVPIFSTLGNHELGEEEDLYHEYFGRGSYQFVYRGAYFTLVDSASATLAPMVYDWLDAWLPRAEGSFHSFYMHIPPLDPAGVRNGGFASRGEANKLVSRLADANVDVTFYGHVHSYYAYANAGIPSYITGGGGAVPEKFDRMGRHFLVVDVDPATQAFSTAIVRID